MEVLKKSFLWVIYFLISSQITFATNIFQRDTFHSEIDTLQIDELTIVGSRQETLLTRSPNSVSLLAEEELKNQPYISLPDVISSMPGIWMQKTNHGGGSPFIRGLTGYQTLILIDGVRFNNSIFRSGPNQYLNTINSLSLGGIEVLRGSGSVQYGSDAIGGTIYLKTKNADFLETGKKISVIPYLKWGSRETGYAGRGEFIYQDANTVSIVGLDYKKYGDIYAGGDLGILSPTGYDEYSADIKIRQKLNENNELSFLFQHLSQQDVPLYHKINPGDYSTYHFDPQQRNLFYLKHTLKSSKRWLSKVTTTLSYQNSLEIRKLQKTGETILRKETDEVSTIGFNIESLSRFTPNWSMTTGFESYYDMVNSNTLTSFPDGSNYQSRGLYPDNSWVMNNSFYNIHQYGYKKLYLQGGLRYNSFILNINNKLFGATEIKPNAFVGSIAANYELLNNTFLFLSVSSAFRAPNINDVSSFGITDFRYEIPNYNLQPEYSKNYEAGIKIKTNKTYFSASLYRNDLTDLITNVEASYLSLDSIEGFKVYQRENSNKARIMGAEAEYKIQVNRNLKFSGFLIYSHGENISGNEPMRRIPPLNTSTSLEYRVSSGFTTRLSWLMAGEQNRLSGGDISDDRIADGGTPSWNILNLHMNYSFSKLNLNIGIINLFDTAYRIHGSGVDAPGRYLSTSVSYIF